MPYVETWRKDLENGHYLAGELGSHVLLLSYTRLTLLSAVDGSVLTELPGWLTDSTTLSQYVPLNDTTGLILHGPSVEYGDVYDFRIRQVRYDGAALLVSDPVSIAPVSGSTITWNGLDYFSGSMGLVTDLQGAAALAAIGNQGDHYRIGATKVTVGADGPVVATTSTVIEDYVGVRQDEGLYVAGGAHRPGYGYRILTHREIGYRYTDAGALERFDSGGHPTGVDDQAALLLGDSGEIALWAYETLVGGSWVNRYWSGGSAVEPGMEIRTRLSESAPISTRVWSQGVPTSGIRDGALFLGAYDGSTHRVLGTGTAVPSGDGIRFAPVVGTSAVLVGTVGSQGPRVHYFTFRRPAITSGPMTQSGYFS